MNLVAEAGDVAVRMAAQDEANVARGEAAGGVRKGLLHEGVVAQVRVGIGDNREKTTTGSRRAFARSTARSSAELSWARWARCIQ